MPKRIVQVNNFEDRRIKRDDKVKFGKTKIGQPLFKTEHTWCHQQFDSFAEDILFIFIVSEHFFRLCVKHRLKVKSIFYNCVDMGNDV